MDWVHKGIKNDSSWARATSSEALMSELDLKPYKYTNITTVQTAYSALEQAPATRKG